MSYIYLERHDLDKNIRRFYQIYVVSGVFVDWSLVREWERAVSPHLAQGML